MRESFPMATQLRESAQTIGSTGEALIRHTGFDVIPDPTRRLPNHYRLIHPDRAAGFNDENLARLASVFIDTPGDPE